MSADNGIYIAKFPDGYRVAHAAAIDNLDYYPEGSEERKQVLKDYFGDAKVFQTHEEAYSEAKRIEKEWVKDDEDFCFLEYGICTIGEYEDFKVS